MQEEKGIRKRTYC